MPISNRNIQDALLNPAPFALPSAASSSTTSAAMDFGGDKFQAGDFELKCDIPALSSTIVPDTRTVTVSFETSNTSNFAAVERTIASDTFTGAGGNGIAAQSLRTRIPSDCERYVRAKVTFGASTTTGAAFNATPAVCF